MKNLPFVILTTVVLIGVITSISLTRCGMRHVNTDYGDTIVSSVKDGEEEKYILYDLEADTTDYSLIVKYKNIEVHWDTESNARHLTDDMDHKEGVLLMRYVDNILSDSSIIVGPYITAIGDNYECKVISGVDTVNLDIRKPLPQIINTRRLGELPGCKNYRISKHYALSDSAWTTDFQLNISVQDSTPKFMLQFISNLIRDNVAGYFDHLDGDKWIEVPMSSYQAKSDNINSMMHYYYQQFCKWYDKEFKDNLSEEDAKNGYWATGDRYSYQLYVYPVWENSNKSLTTWKFYTYKYLGGAHGGEKEYYLTFDNYSQRILEIRDFYKKKDIPDAYDNLKRQLNDHYRMRPDNVYDFSADLDTAHRVDILGNNILNEWVNGKLYPRPAITRNGLVFTYQTYEKGSNADGILHFTQHYRKDFKLKR